ncbi:MAG: RND transporter [Gammaproteobacteria bacterium]|nr:MAG: RND transporter [Gammaproteobacteria bacterium]
MEHTLAKLFTQYRLPMALATLCLLFIAGFGAQHLTFNNNYRALFKADNPQLQAYDQLNQSYNESDSVIFLLGFQEQSVFTQHNLKLISDFIADAQLIPFAQGAQGITNFQRSIPTGDGDFTVQYLVPDASALNDAEVKEIQQYVNQEPLIQGRLVSSHGNVASIYVTVTLPEERREAISAAAEYAQALKDRYLKQYPGLVIHVSGGVPLAESFVEVATHDALQLFPIVVLLGLVIQALLFRSLSAVVVSMGVVLVSIVFTLGLAGWLGYSLNQTSILAPMLVLTLALADTTHVISEYLNLRRQGHDELEAMQASLEDNIQPIFLTSVTTAIGLLCMNFSDSPPFHDFANITAFGVISAFVFTLTLLPAFLLAMPVKVSEADLTLTHGMRWLSKFSIRHRHPLFIGTSIFVLTCAYFIPHNKLNDDLIEYFDESLEIRQAADFAIEHFKGRQTLVYSFESGEAYGINAPEFLAQVEQFTHWYRQQEEVVQIISYLDTLKKINQNMHAGNPQWNKIPDSRELAGQYMFLYELSLQPGQDLNDQLDIDRSELKLTVLTQKLGNQDFIALEKRADQWLKDNLPALNVVSGGQSAMFAHLGFQVISSMIEGSLTALALITVVLIIGLKSLRYGLLSLIPNIFPAAVIYGLWGLFVGEINQAAAVTFSVSLGIVVDDTVHILSKYMSARKKGQSVEQAIEYSFTTAGTAMIITSVVLASGLLVLSQSVFGINAIIGSMVAPIIVFALLVDFLFLPSILYYFDSGKDHNCDQSTPQDSHPQGSQIKNLPKQQANA